MSEHPSGIGTSASEYEVETAEGIRTAIDPRRAHAAAGDPGYEHVVEDCGLCQAKRLALIRMHEQEGVNDGKTP